jgi:hypothetical protein
MTDTLDSTAVAPRRRVTWRAIAVAIVFAVLYAYVLWGAVGNLVSLPALFGTVTPWWLLILDVAAPVIVYVVALVLGRRQTLVNRVVFFLVGAAVVSCVAVASIAYIHTHFGIA